MTSSQVAYLALILAVAAIRLVELAISRRHQRRLEARGAFEVGAGHYPVMVALHTGLLLAAPAEVLLLDRPFIPGLGWPMLALLAATMALRWWVIATLGERWTTRVIVLPGAPLVTAGPYHRLRHPNYLAVAFEIVALPLVHTAWWTATAFGLANLWLLAHRIGVEESALGDTETPLEL
ncbi:MAG TPA: isoprenylcysteine carboxylmethyltransferase family protein [Thermoanaerobaculia bacterium]|nr:isoprenylcysteine carboxylmethyltransferase family protein [Thermoanaerobaculia bacterium]